MSKLIRSAKKKLLGVKGKILSLRKAYNRSKELLTNFLKSDLSKFVKSENGLSYMKKFNVNSEEELKLKALNIYKHFYTKEEYFVLENSIKGNALKRVQNV